MCYSGERNKNCQLCTEPKNKTKLKTKYIFTYIPIGNDQIKASVCIRFLKYVLLYTLALEA